MGRCARLRLFGGFQLQAHDGRPVSVSSRKGQAVLAYLACLPGAAATRETLASLLWSESDSRKAYQNLRQVLFKLGRALAQVEVPILAFQGDRIGLRRDALWLDLTAFDQLPAAPSSAALARASKLYVGPVLQGLTVEARPFEDWLLALRNRYQERALRYLSGLMDGMQAAGDFESAIEAGTRALEIEPCREDIHRRLMQLYLIRRMRASALMQYRKCRDALRDELQVAPDPETEALYRLILNAGTLEVADSRRRAETAGSSRWAIGDAMRLAPIGRSADLAALREDLAAVARSGCRMTALAGVAGGGTSQLLRVFLDSLCEHASTAFCARARRTERFLSLSLWSELADALASPNDTAVARPGRGLREARTPFEAVEGRDSERRNGWGGRGGEVRRGLDPVILRLRALARRAPIVVVLEDLQWADADSLRLINQAVRRLRDRPALFLVTLRAEDPDAPLRLDPMLRDLE